MSNVCVNIEMMQICRLQAYYQQLAVYECTMIMCTKSTNQGNFEGTCIGTYELSNSKQHKCI